MEIKDTLIYCSLHNKTRMSSKDKEQSFDTIVVGLPSQPECKAAEPVSTDVNQDTWKDTTTGESTADISTSSSEHPQSTITEQPIVNAEGLKRIMSPKDCVSDLINLKKEFPVEIYENERYAPFSNWSASSLLPSG